MQSYRDDFFAWEQVKYGEIFQRKSKMGVSTPALPSIEYDDINPGMGTLNKEPKSKVTSKRGIYFNPGDVLFGKLRPYLKNWLFACFEGVAVGDFWVLTSSKIDHGFTYSLIQAPEFQYIANLSSGSKMPRSDWGLVSNARTFIPTNLSEQKSISSVLFGLDTAITLHEEKKRQLELLKSALLQKMFADKSGYPAVRFEGFSDESEQCKLSDISEKSYEKNTDNKYSTVLTNSAEYGIVKQRDFFDKDIANSSNISGYYVVRKNYFIYNPRISNQAKFGPINRNKLDETGIMSPLYLVFTVHNIDESFLETLFQTTTWHRFMYQNGDTGARADRFAIKDSTFMSMPIKVPTLEEQHKLAFAFQKLDRTITLHVQKLSLLKRVKQTLLQKMFI